MGVKWSDPRSPECPFPSAQFPLVTVQTGRGEAEIQVEVVKQIPLDAKRVNPLGCAGHSVPIAMVDGHFRKACGRCLICSDLVLGQEIT